MPADLYISPLVDIARFRDEPDGIEDGEARHLQHLLLMHRAISDCAPHEKEALADLEQKIAWSQQYLSEAGKA